MQKTTEEKRGFALAMVVFMLFAAAVAGMTGYQIVSNEASLADGNENQDEALAVANAGMQRYIGEHIGIPGPATYGAIGSGSATITGQRVARVNDSTDLYLLKSVGTVTDPRYPTSPATRTVYQHANLNRRPVKAKAAFVSIQGTINVAGASSGEVEGNPSYGSSYAADCPPNDDNDITAVSGVGKPTAGGLATGLVSPGTVLLGAVAGVISAAEVRWSVLKDPTFPIPFDGTWPNFATLALDSFPIVRVTGNYTLDRSGRGALIVTGNFSSSASTGYTWKGIVLAGGATATSYSVGSGAGSTVQGVLISGLNGTTYGAGTQTVSHFHARWFPCYVRWANLSLAYLTPVNRSSWTF